MRRTAICVVMLLVLGVAAPANAAIRIMRIAFDPAGADTGERRHLSKEYIVIKNTGSRAIRLDGWKLHDQGRDHVYVFGDESRGQEVFTDLRLRPGEYDRLHSGRGQDSATATTHGDVPTHYDFYWDLDNYVWNNDGDKATLKNRDRDVVDTCGYSASADSPKPC